MSREILFKAKRRNWRELPEEAWWVEGYYVYFEKMKNACMYHTYKGAPLVTDVDSETVCQYTGLTDKNGRKIFEGDICKTKFFGKDNGKGQNFADYDIFKIVYKDGTHLLGNKQRQFSAQYIPNMVGNGIEVIGNIFDNPELLEGDMK